MLSLALFLLAVSGLNTLSSTELQPISLETNAEQTSWAQCAIEVDTNFQSCLSKYEPTLIRFGKAPNWFYHIVPKNQSIPCTYVLLGDPAPGIGKVCEMKKLDITDKGLAWPTSWKDLPPPAGGSTTLGSGCTGFKWVRGPYGTGSYYYLLKGTVYYQGTNISVGNTCVSFGKADYCAAENQNCSMSASATSYYIVEVRTTDGSESQVRLGSVPTLPCSTSRLNLPVSAGKPKECYTYKRGPQFGIPVGQWILSGSGSQASVTLTEQVQRSSSQSGSVDWGASLTTTVEAGYEFEGFSAKVSVSASVWASESKAYSNEIAKMQSKSCTSTCSKKGLYLYQWSLSVPEHCDFNDFGCSVDIGTCNFRCRPNATAPACPYFRCCGTGSVLEMCTKCLDKTGACVAS